jgi:hypothetical protein
MANLCYNVDSSILNYEQARNNRERIKTEDRITEQTTLLIAIGSEVDEQGSLLRRIADGIAAAARGSGKLINYLFCAMM